MGIDVSSCIMDAGYNSGDNLDLFYDENHKCKIGFITRIGSGDEAFKSMIKDEVTVDEMCEKAQELVVKYTE